MSLIKALRWLSPLLVAATFLPFFATNSPNLGMDFFLYNSAPLLTLFLTFKSLNQDEKVAKVALRLALLSWIAGSVLSSVAAIYLLSQNTQIVANFFYLFLVNIYAPATHNKSLFVFCRVISSLASCKSLAVFTLALLSDSTVALIFLAVSIVDKFLTIVPFN